MSIRKYLAAASIAFLLATWPATALDPNTRITQYRHTAWRVQEGAFESAPTAITQTADGYIWIGTGSGLVKHDGVRFVPWAPPAGKGPFSTAIYSLRGSSDGTLWIGTGTRIFSWKNNKMTEQVLGRINSILEDRKGRIWAARSRTPDLKGGLCQIAGDHPGCIGDGPMMMPNAQTLTQDVHGDLWVGASGQLMQWNDSHFASYFKKEFEPFEGLSSVTDVAAGADGSIWAAIPRKGFGLVQIVAGIPRKLEQGGINPEQVRSLFMDRDNSLWIGTSSDGVYRISGKRVDHFRSEDGLSSNAVTNFYQDREGNLWLATSKGLDCFRESRVVTFSTREGLTADLAGSVLASDDGSLWIGNEGSLDVLRAGKVTSIRIPGQSVTSLWQDSAKRLLVGVDKNLTVYENGQFRKINRLDGSPLGTVVAITEDREQNIWVSVVGANRKLFRIRNLRVQEEFTLDQIPLARLLAADPTGGIWGLANGKLGHYHADKLESFPLPQGAVALSGLTIDADGSAWISTADGIVHWKNREMKTLTSRNGLPCDGIFSTIRDNKSTLWIYAKCGLIGIEDSELERWWQQPDTRIQFQFFDVFDGTMPGPSTFQPAVAKSSDGRLWFSNDTGVQMIDPGDLRKNHILPPVYVEEVHADRKDYAIGGVVHLPPRSRDIEIGYTALSFSVPQKVLFRYRLDGRDQEWQAAGTRRQIFYTDLPPGQYRFHVMAANNDGVWNDAGASLDFYIDPAYYQTRWFQAAGIGFVLVMIWGLYRYRLRQIAHEFNVRLNERVGERVRIARDLHDTLLQSFQGLMLRLQVVEDLLPEGKPKEQLEQVLQRADQAIAEGRSAVYDLRSSATLTNDLAEAMRALGEELATEDSASFRLVVEGLARDLHPIIRDELYRITSEALRNAFSHACARHIETELIYGVRVFRLRIRDDGQGIPPEILKQGRAGHYGLPGMRERAAQIGGKLEIWSGAGAGTEIELSIAGSIAYSRSIGRRLFGLFRKKAG